MFCVCLEQEETVETGFSHESGKRVKVTEIETDLEIASFESWEICDI